MSFFKVTIEKKNCIGYLKAERGQEIQLNVGQENELLELIHFSCIRVV